MKRQKPDSQWMNMILVALCLALIAGCSTARGYKEADKTGEAITTLRNDVVNIKTAVDGSMKALDGLGAAASTDPRPAYEAFAKSVDKVEDAGNTAKKDAEAMRQRGEAYFKEWETQLGTVNNEDIRRLSEDRKAKLQEAFGNIKYAAEDARTSYPQFLSNLKDLRTALGSDLSVQGIEAAKDIFKKTKDSGVEVQIHLDSLINELNSVVADITAAKTPTAKAPVTQAPAKK